MSEKIIGETEFELDLKNLPQMTEEQMARLRAMTDEEIDYSDTPSQAGKLGRRSSGMFCGPAGALRRAALAEKLLLVEPDVLEFFNASGDGAPERMNAVLRDYVERQRKRA
jgi:uncharacterized protein (DUF4415 family)